MLFRSVVLSGTLLRPPLNVASTRVGLSNVHEGPGAAGQVIEAFGSFVIGGNFAVGLVVFAIITIINFVVVTKGSTRVSEVTARFTLDAMPGKQMAIDRSEESRVGKECVSTCRSRWSPFAYITKQREDTRIIKIIKK